jgi:hypothetical protein
MGVDYDKSKRVITTFLLKKDVKDQEVYITKFELKK